MVKNIAVNELGCRVGDSHHNAKLTDQEVGLLLELYEKSRWGYRRLAAKFEISKSLARNICKGRARCQTPSAWRVVHVMG